MALTFSSDALPAGWQHGAFLVFHGSRGRRPLPEDGHYALFVELDQQGAPLGPQRIFAASSQGPGALRLSGVAIAPDGRLFLSDDDHGRIFMVRPGTPVVR
jgi:glucose/arabinose dehydrogenase